MSLEVRSGPVQRVQRYREDSKKEAGEGAVQYK